MSSLGTASLILALASLGLTALAGIWELHQARLDWQLPGISGVRSRFLAPANIAIAGTAIAMLAIAFYLASRMLVAGHVSLTTPVASCLVLALGILGAGIYFPVRYHVGAIRPIAVVIAVIVLAVASVLPSTPTPAPPLHYLLALRTGALAVACGAFTATLGGAVLFLARVYGSTIRLPSGEALEEMSGRAAMAGFLAMVLALVFGSLWSGSILGKYWSGSPAEGAGMATCLLYAGYLHARTQVEWRGTKSAAMLIIGFFLSLLAFAYQIIA